MLEKFKDTMLGQKTDTFQEKLESSTKRKH